MSKIDIIEQLLAQGMEFDFNEVIISLVLSLTLTYILGKVYIKYGRTLSNRSQFANNLLLIGVTTTIVISIIKSSLALSLGLVGSLSIIRFRTAIKEPEELAFLFITIAIGLGCGAYHWWLTTTSLIIVITVITIRGLTRKKEYYENMIITVSTLETPKINLKKITEILANNCDQVKLKRYDLKEDEIEASYLINIKSLNKLNEIKDRIKELSKNANITYLDNE